MVLAWVVLVRAVGPSGWREVLERLRGASWSLLALAMAINLARYAVWAERLALLMRPVARVGWPASCRALLASQFITTAVPASQALGGVLRARFLVRQGLGPKPALYAGALLDQIGYGITSACLGALLLPVAARPGRGGALVAVLVLVPAIVLVLRAYRERLLAMIARRLPRAEVALTASLEDARRILRRPASLLIVIAGGACTWLATALCLMVTAHALGLPLDFGAAAAAWAVGSLFASMTGAPGGLGATESAGALALTQLTGLGAPDALACLLVTRSFHYLSALLLGGLAYGWRWPDAASASRASAA